MNQPPLLAPPPLPPPQRPALVWVISIFYAFGVVSTLASFALVYMPGFPMAPAQKAYFASLTVVDHAMTALVMLVNLAGAILLFFLKRAAPLFFTIALALGIASVVYQIVTKNWFAAVGIIGVISVVFGWTINIVIVVYTFLLRKRRVLS